jgi:mannosyltransferase OCH1-like enzyme
MIPKKIHYCWFGGSEKHELLKKCMSSWTRHMPDWEVIEWNETNTPLESDYVAEAYAQGLWALVSDYARLQALFTHGGIYLDTDVEVIRPLDAFLANECFVGFQVEEERLDWVNNAVLGASAGHPFLPACMGYARWHFENLGKFAISPVVTTQVLRYVGLRQYGFQELDGVTIYPAQYFYPYPWFAQYSDDCVTSDTYCIHYWERSWQRPRNAPAQHALRHSTGRQASPSQELVRTSECRSERTLRNATARRRAHHGGRSG